MSDGEDPEWLVTGEYSKKVCYHNITPVRFSLPVAPLIIEPDPVVRGRVVHHNPEIL